MLRPSVFEGYAYLVIASNNVSHLYGEILCHGYANFRRFHLFVFLHDSIGAQKSDFCGWMVQII